MTEILFCDLCNESVPEPDLTEGRAFRIKGRVVCSACDRAMRGERGHGDAATQAPRGEPMAQATPAPAAAHSHGAAPGSSGGLAAVGLAVAALAVTIVLGYWMDDQLEQVEQRGAQRADELAGSQRELRSDTQRAMTELSTVADSVDAKLASGMADQRTRLEQRLDQRLGEAAKQAGDLAQQIAALERRLAELREPLAALPRQDADLAELRGRSDELAGELKGLAGRIEELAAQRSSPPPGAAPIEPQGKPAWWDLVAKLTSAQINERYDAVNALAETHDPAVAPHLVTALKDVDPFVRLSVARALEGLGNPVAVAPLIDALNDANTSVREAVYFALQTITKRDLPFDPHSEDAAERQRRIKAWRDWWEKERGRYGA